MGSVHAARKHTVSSWPEPAKPAPPGLRPVAVAYQMRNNVWVDYEISTASAEGPVELVVRVNFPDETRSVLESLSWGGSNLVLDVLFQIGALFIEDRLSRPELDRFISPFERNSKGRLVLNLTFDELVATLDRLESSPRAPRRYEA